MLKWQLLGILGFAVGAADARFPACLRCPMLLFAAAHTAKPGTSCHKGDVAQTAFPRSAAFPTTAADPRGGVRAAPATSRTGGMARPSPQGAMDAARIRIA
jgi:hypothetical protein